MAAKLAFTCGDPAGVGPEIIASWLAAHADEAAGMAVIGGARWLESLETPAEKIAVGLDSFSANLGKPDGEGALVAWAAMERAAAGTVSGEFSGVVTGPISKERLANIGYEFPGADGVFRRPVGRGTRHGILRRQAPGGAGNMACAALRSAAAARTQVIATHHRRCGRTRAGGRHCDSANWDLWTKSPRRRRRHAWMRRTRFSQSGLGAFAR